MRLQPIMFLAADGWQQGVEIFEFCLREETLDDLAHHSREHHLHHTHLELVNN